jgi:DNA-directed RNA polymerase specialized sigma24 family protein
VTVAQSEIVRIFETNRPHLMGLAYRMSGSVADAEDVIQDAWLRWQETDHAVVMCPKAYQLRLTMRLCLDRALGAGDEQRASALACMHLSTASHRTISHASHYCRHLAVGMIGSNLARTRPFKSSNDHFPVLCPRRR